MDTAKTCTRCDQKKPLDQFVKRTANRDGRTNVCKVCHGSSYKDPGKQRAADRRYDLAHPGKRKQAAARWDQEHPWSKRGRDARRRARKAGATISEVDMATVRASRPDCYLCGLLLGGEVHLDHVVPLARGGAHAVDNLLPTHATCNLRKGDRLLSELKWYVAARD